MMFLVQEMLNTEKDTASQTVSGLTTGNYTLKGSEIMKGENNTTQSCSFPFLFLLSISNQKSEQDMTSQVTYFPLLPMQTLFLCYHPFLRAFQSLFLKHSDGFSFVNFNILFYSLTAPC